MISVDAALSAVALYRPRWRIEEYNRSLKKSGIDLEGAMIEGSLALQNLVAIGAVAGVAVMQLVEGRDAGPERRDSANDLGADEGGLRRNRKPELNCPGPDVAAPGFALDGAPPARQ